MNRPSAVALVCLFTILFLALPRQALAQDAPLATGLGLTLEQMDSAALDFFEQELGARFGVLINFVTAGSPAAKGGVLDGDLLTHVGGIGVATIAAVEQGIARARGAAELRVVRRGEEGLLTLNLRVAVPGSPPAGNAPGVAAPPPNPLGGAAPPANPLGGAAGGPGWELREAPAAVLDRIQEQLGTRAGVVVNRVVAGGPAARAGIVAGDVLLKVGGQAVATPAAVERLLSGREGALEVVVLRADREGSWRFETLGIALTGGTAAPATLPGAGATAGTAGMGLPPVVTAFFDMLDFCRTEAWRRNSVTDTATRARAAHMLAEAGPELDPESRAALARIPGMWEELKRKWAGATEVERERQRGFWRGLVLGPNPLLPLTAETREYRNKHGSVTFDIPTAWFVSETEAEGMQILLTGPPVQEMAWETALDPATAPPSALLVIAPLEADLGGLGDPVAAARVLAKKYVVAGSPGMKEVGQHVLGKMGLVVLSGRLRGREEDSFLWMGAIRWGSDHVLICRMLAPVSGAEAILPAFSQLLETSRLRTPDQDEATAFVDLAFAQIGGLYAWH